MIGCLRTSVHKQPIIALYFEFETVGKFITSGPQGYTKSCSTDNVIKTFFSKIKVCLAFKLS